MRQILTGNNLIRYVKTPIFFLKVHYVVIHAVGEVYVGLRNVRFRTASGNVIHRDVNRCDGDSLLK